MGSGLAEINAMSEQAAMHAPYKIVKDGDQWCVLNNLGEVKARFKTHAKAMAYMAALYRNVPGAAAKAARTPWTGRAGKSGKSEAAARDPKKPYGDVTYADPGYQDDGKKRYPLDTADHVRAAWSYINQPGNAAKYTGTQLALIKGRIRAAARRFNVAISSGKEAAGLGSPAPAARGAPPAPGTTPAPVITLPAVPVGTTSSSANHTFSGVTTTGQPVIVTVSGTTPATPVASVETADSHAPSAILTEIGGRTLLTTSARVVTDPAQVPRELAAAYEQAAKANPELVWLTGRFVEAERANRNGAYWTTQDLEFGETSVRNGPLNWLHDATRVIGTLTDAKLFYPEVAGDRAHIVAQAAIWPWLYPGETDLIRTCSDAGKLWFSMECRAQTVRCETSGDGERVGCGREFTSADVYDHPERSCQHLRERSSQRRMVNPTFYGGAVILPPAQPGWAGADVRLASEAASLAEATAASALREGLGDAEWEGVMGQVVRFAHAREAR